MINDPAVEAMLLTMFKRSVKEELPLAWEAVRSEARIALAAAYEAEAVRLEGVSPDPRIISMAEWLRQRAAALRGGAS